MQSIRLKLANSRDVLLPMVKYGIVGAAAFVVDYGLLILLANGFGINYIVSSSLAFCVSIFVSYFGSIGWVFNNPDTGNHTRDVIMFFVIGGVGLGLTDLFLWFFTEIVGLYYLISKIIATVIVFFWNFFARKIFLDKMAEINNENIKRTDSGI